MNTLLSAALTIALLLGLACSSATAVAATHTATKHKVVKKRMLRKSASVAKGDPIPADATKWSCGDSQALYVSGDMKRDQIITLNWQGRDYKLPRQGTTTGADRFHDPASGMDLVVIPFKAMLFSDREGSRLADDCKTQAMLTQGAPAPTQSNALLKNLQ